MDEKLKRFIFEAELEKQRAQDTYRKAKEAKNARSKRNFDFLVDGIVICVILYCIFLLKNSFGFSNIKILDGQFFTYIAIIIFVVVFSGFLFVKK